MGEKKDEIEWKDNSAVVDWTNNAGADCVFDQQSGHNKCYNWEFEKDGKIKHVASQFYLCADSWGEHGGDYSLRVWDFNHLPNRKDEYDPTRGYLWEPVCD